MTTTVEPLIKKNWMILAIVRSEACLAREYIEDLTAGDKKKVWALLDFTAEHGPPKNTQKFNHLKESIYEFKSFQDRLACFDGQNRIVITHGWKRRETKLLKRKSIEP